MQPQSAFYSRTQVQSKRILFLCLLTLLGLHAQVNAQAITGNVFRDFNANGTKDTGTSFNEVGVGGVTVKCTDSVGGTATTTTSTATGTLGDYSLSICTGATRVEFTWTQIGDYSGATGTGSNTSVQFVDAATSPTNVNYGINYPSDYCQPNPDLTTSLFVNGGLNSTTPTSALVKFPYSNSGTSPAPPSIGSKMDLGSVYGLAYAKTSNALYSSAFLKRHVAMGPGGLGAIYKTDLVTNTNSLWLDVSTLASLGTIPSNTTRGLDPTTAPNSPTTDPDVFPMIGKVGMGDLDISEDEKTLYVVNLNNRSVIAIDIATKTIKSTIAIPDPVCTQGTYRPFGLAVNRGSVYAGVICDASISGLKADLRAIVYKINGATASNVLDFSLDFRRGYVVVFGTILQMANHWFPWLDTYSDTEYNWDSSQFNLAARPSPLLSDIAFDEKGDMILGFMDRAGHQLGYNNYPPNSTAHVVLFSSGGDVMKAGLNGAGAYVLESNGSVNGIAGSGVGNNNGPGGGEFFALDKIPSSAHQETAAGALAYWQGSSHVNLTLMDPINVDSGGTGRFSTADGTSDNLYQMYSYDSLVGGFFGKANGLGDLEALCAPAPLEIGNRVWLDTDKDGIQDPDEAGIDGVTVTLMIGTDMVTTTTTTVNGQAGVYYFKDGMTGLPAAWNGIIPRNALAKLFVADTYTSGATTYKATIANAGTNDAIDADGIHMASQGTTAASVRIDLNTGQAGQNNHTYDFGYNVDTLMNFLNCAEVSAQDQTDLDSTPADGTGDEYACATTTKTTSVTYDWGDNPDTGAGSGAGNYLTSLADNGPRHQIVTGLKLGASVDAETDGQGTGTTSTGDDTTGTPDDEDGVTLPTFTEGVATPLNFTLMNMTGTAAKLCGWIDFDKNGVYSNTTERQCTNVADAATTATLTFTAPTGTSGTTYARFRLSTDAAFIAAMDPTGSVTSGEVEDYQATITSAPIFDLALDKKLSTGQAATVNAGDLVSFDITVYNQGSVDATAISITDYIDTTKFDAFAVADNPAGNSTVTVLPYTWSAAGVATLTGTLPMGASLKIPVKLRIKAGATGTAVNKAEISAATGGTDIDSTPDGTDGNQTGEVLPVMVDDQVTGNGTTGGDEDDHDLAQVTINVPLTADLELIKIADKTQVRVGDLLTYTLQITNKGPGTATAVKVKDTLPIGVSLQGSPVASVGSFDSATGIWTVGDMLNGSMATLTITVIVQ